ncbi:MAG TPA: sulfurtransferase TusA family protein [Candidatus Binatia bacterium]|nr:sulfurtransferase TusA family protein [Candidatus Binatia bacterium]
MTEPRRLDLRGVRCPLSWAKAKVRLETLTAGEALELLLDDEKGARDIPRAAEAEGYAVDPVEHAPPVWRLVIHR